MEELSHDQIIAIEEFVRGIRECFLNKMNDGDKFNQIFMTYALQILDIHLSLAQLKFERWSNNMAKEFANGK